MARTGMSVILQVCIATNGEVVLGTFRETAAQQQEWDGSAARSAPRASMIRMALETCKTRR
jgi:hypothetical protein